MIILPYFRLAQPFLCHITNVLLLHISYNIISHFACHHYFLNGSTWWCNNMEMVSASLALCKGQSPLTSDSPHKGLVVWMFFFILKRLLRKQSICHWYEILWCSCDAIGICCFTNIIFIFLISPWTKFCRRYFQMHYCEWKVLYLIKISLKFVPKVPFENNPALFR